MLSFMGCGGSRNIRGGLTTALRTESHGLNPMVLPLSIRFLLTLPVQRDVVFG